MEDTTYPHPEENLHLHSYDMNLDIIMRNYIFYNEISKGEEKIDEVNRESYDELPY